jgi:hypothetical protein
MTQGERNLQTWLSTVAQYNNRDAFELQGTVATVSAGVAGIPETAALINQTVEPDTNGYIPTETVTAYALRAEEVPINATSTGTVAFSVVASINGTVNSTFNVPSVPYAVTTSTYVYCRCTSSSWCECLQSDLEATECADYIGDGRTTYSQRGTSLACSRGAYCGTCTRPTFFAEACFPVSFLGAASGWAATTLKTCDYPFSGTYARPAYTASIPPTGVNVTLRSNIDPYVLLAYQTDGAMGFYDPATPSPYSPPSPWPYGSTTRTTMTRRAARTLIGIGAVLLFLSVAASCLLAHMVRTAAATLTMTTTTTTTGMPGGAPGYPGGAPGGMTTTTTTTAAVATAQHNPYNNPTYGNPTYGTHAYSGGFMGTLFGMNHYNPNVGLWGGGAPQPPYPAAQQQPPMYPQQQPPIQMVQVHPAMPPPPPPPPPPMGYVQPQPQPSYAYSPPQPTPPSYLQPQPQQVAPPPTYAPSAAYGPPPAAAASPYPVYGIPVDAPPMGYTGQQQPPQRPAMGYSETSVMKY